MKKMSEPIVFFGSGPVAAASLQLLTESFTIEAVITKPRPEGHKGSIPVIDVAKNFNLPVKTARSSKDLDTIFIDSPFKSKVGVLVDFGIFVSQQVIDYFPSGIINSHFSLLPEWRGADPITFSILSGQNKTGVSLMQVVKAMDEGPLLAQAIFKLSPHITAPQLTSKLIDLSDSLLQEILPLWMSGDIEAIPQNQSHISGKLAPTYSRRLTKEDGRVDWNKKAEAIEREIRAYILWPKSSTTLNNIDLTITKAHVVHKTGPVGTITIHDHLPAVYCGSDLLVLDKVKPASKQEMTGQAFLAGYGNRLLS